MRIPYNPTFLNQVKDGNVKEISSTGDSIQGTFKQGGQVPVRRAERRAATTNFSTQVPSFANNTQLSNLLQEQERHDRRPVAGLRARRSSRA